MTYQEAKQKLEADGYSGEPTPEALKLAGWDADESIRETKAIGMTQPTFTDDELKTSAAHLQEEMKANALPANIVKSLTTVLGTVAKAGLLALMLCVLLGSNTGCSSAAAQSHVDEIEALSKNYAAKTQIRQTAQIADYRRSARAQVDELNAAAIAAEKKRIDLTPQQMADNCVALTKTKIDDYAKIEQNCIQLQRDFDSDRADVIQLTRKTSELRDYFKTQNDTGQIFQDASKSLIDSLGALKGGKAAK